MKTAGLMKRALELCALLLFSLTIMLSAGNIAQAQRDASAIPELEDHKKIFELLPAVTSELGMDLSTAYQLLPEQSTAAIIVHHPQAKYYSVGESRVEQLMK